MKKIFLLFMLAPFAANADTPSASCPSGYVAITEEFITVATSCPTGTSSAGTADSCLVSSPNGSCIMYAPAGTSYVDPSGTYEFTAPCEMTD